MNQFFILFSISFVTNLLFRFAMSSWSNGVIGVGTIDIVGAAILAAVLAFILPMVPTAKK